MQLLWFLPANRNLCSFLVSIWCLFRAPSASELQLNFCFNGKVNRGLDPESGVCRLETHRANSADTRVYGALPVPRLRSFLGEEEVHFIVVSIGIVRNEVGGDEFWIFEERRQRQVK